MFEHFHFYNKNLRYLQLIKQNGIQELIFSKAVLPKLLTEKDLT